ncbi:MAG: SRPBCC family protein [Deltaproteobacteria bacterium]|nr:MAG: SRPBCC family protein [Deltaproteobacteria bacterium]
MLKPFAIVLVVLVGVPTVLWGFPGVWALVALIPAFIIAATAAHLMRPREAGSQSRPGVILLGVVFGLITGAGAVLTMWASAAPEEIVIAQDVVVPMPRDAVWRTVGDPMKRPAWNTWIHGIEPKGEGGPPAVGAAYNVDLFLERGTVRHEYELTAYTPEERTSFTITPLAGVSQIEDMRESITLGDGPDGKTTIHYELRYAVRSVLGRAIERLVIRRSLEKVVEASLARLEEEITK